MAEHGHMLQRFIVKRRYYPVFVEFVTSLIKKTHFSGLHII